MNYNTLNKQEKFLLLDLIELSFGGDKSAKEDIEAIINENVTSAGMLYNIMSDIHKSLSPNEKAEDHNRLKGRLTTPIPVKLKTPQDRWQEKAGLISKSYKLQKDVVDDFAKACDVNGISQAKKLTELMSTYSNEILKNKEQHNKD